MYKQILYYTYYLLPYKIERLLDHANSQSNMGVYGLYLGVRNRRNMIYITTYFGTIFLLLKYKIVSTALYSLLSIQLYFYSNYLYKYRYYF